ncbi:glycosyltransferase [Lapillicoccus jejuensis]|uniref:Glycosyl transferase family 1 n=1 Tax=Lapillicoccus jejuensis TaxID=402171 RepID=A0A542DW06_9MICO|nr:glycosyltransferase [Lapillicoccus jejuensis]TQJ07277.1 glycosyl transferase family 1 [Lapillicoccus jejuensis]
MSPLHTVAAYGPAAGSTRVRLLDWVRHLDLPAQHHGYRGGRDNALGGLARDPLATLRAERSLHGLRLPGHRVLLSREASPLSTGAVEERLLRDAGRGTYDLDDALFHDDVGPRRLLGRPRRARRAAAAADVVLAGNPYLADWASQHARDVRVVPSCVEPGRYRPVTGWAVGDRPRLVWIGSPSTEAHLATVGPALREVHRRTGAVTLVVSGAAPTAAMAPYEDVVERVPWTPEGFAAALAQGDVGLAPLPDTPWNRGKCAYKLLQYGATALPVVGSPVGANATALERLDGFAVDGVDDWVDALVVALTGSEQERARRGLAARAAVEDHYSFAAWADRWRDAVLGGSA